MQGESPEKYREELLLAQFYNQATLTYTGGTVNSNITVGEVTEVITATKTPITKEYTADSDVTYLISLVNSGDVDVTGVTVVDDLGGYTVGTETVYPLSYVADSVTYLVDGTPSAAPTVTVNGTVTFSDITVPANGNVAIIYEAETTAYAPLGEGATIANSATINGSCIVDPIIAAATVPMDMAPALTISKSLTPDVLSGCTEITYTFDIRNYGGAADAAAQIALADTFDPPLTGLEVTLGGAAFTAYTYSETTGIMTTTAGAITVPAATFTQNTDGTWTTDPGVVTVTVTGTM